MTLDLSRILAAFGLAILIGPIAAPAPARGVPAQLIGDLRTTLRPDGSDPTFRRGIPTVDRPEIVGRSLYFAATDDRHGRELWRLVAGKSPQRLTDICPGPCDSLTGFDAPLVGRLPSGRLVFAADDGETGRHLWVTDGPDFGSGSGPDPGTASGTYRLTPVAITAPSVEAVAASDLEGRVYFAFRGDMWRTDGTVDGTERLDFLPREPSRLLRVGDRLVFVGESDDGSGTHVLWTTDGTADGTERLSARTPPPRGFAGLAADGDGVFGTLVFAAQDSSSRPYLWATGGTPESMLKLVELCPDTLCNYGAFQLFVGGGALLFTVDDNRIWRTDGTVKGSQFLGTFADDPAVDLLGGADDAVLAVTRKNSRTSLWSLPLGGGLPTEPVLVREDFFAFAGASGPDGPFVFSVAQEDLGYEPWISDGSLAGTMPLADLAQGPASSFPQEFQVIGEEVVFTADDGTGVEIYGTDGTPAGTARVADLRGGVGEGSDPSGFVDLGARVLFVADAFTPAITYPLVDSGPYEPEADLFAVEADGTPTLLLRGRRSRNLSTVGNGASARVFFAGRNLPPQDFARSEDHEPWITDGTPGGTRLLAEIEPGTHGSYPRDAVTVGAGDEERLLFFADRGFGAKIWISDGTTAGTNLLADIDPEWDNVHPDEACTDICSPPYPASRIYPREARRFRDQVVFIGHDPDVGEELWITDGTGEGTRPVADLAPGDADSNPEALVVSGNRLFFTTGLPSDDDFALRDLWVFDGSDFGEDAPRRLAESLGATLGLVPLELPGGSGVALLSRGDLDRSQHGTSLWVSDGTVDGTRRIAEFDLPADQLTAAGSLAYFALQTADGGTELARTDGTAEGTFVVFDLWPGDRGSQPRILASRGGEVVFAASNGSRESGGTRLWISDGSPFDTRELATEVPLQAATAGHFDALGRLLVAADDGVRGREPWRIDNVLRPEPCVTDEVHHCLGGRFRIRVDWRVPSTGKTGVGVPRSGTDDTGYFWFFGADNVELAVKVLDGRSSNGHHWLFYGALSDVEYTIHAEDTLTGVTRRYDNPAGNLCGDADVEAFPALPGASTAPRQRPGAGPEPAKAHPGPHCGEGNRLCLQDRFDVSVTWTTDADSGAGRPIPFSDETAMFWFFDDDNVELLVKILDGRPINGKYWVFYGALSDVEYQIRVVDTETGAERVYDNAQGNLCGNADVDAFDP